MDDQVCNFLYSTNQSLYARLSLQVFEALGLFLTVSQVVKMAALYQIHTQSRDLINLMGEKFCDFDLSRTPILLWQPL